MLIAIGIGIAFAVSFGVGFTISAQTIQPDQVGITKAPEGRHFQIELKEDVHAADKPPP